MRDVMTHEAAVKMDETVKMAETVQMDETVQMAETGAETGAGSLDVGATEALVIVISGMSGSGKSSAIQALEDEGFYCIDNLPPALLSQAVRECWAAPHPRHHLAVVLDARAGVMLSGARAAIEGLWAQGCPLKLLFLDASDATLVRRFSETRRRHPLDIQAPKTVGEHIAAERQALVSLRAIATRIIDTSELSRTALKEMIAGSVHAVSTLTVTWVSFGFKYGLPIEADLVFDVRYLRNPFFVPELKSLVGLDPPVRDYVLAQEEAQEWLAKIEGLVASWLPLYSREGKRYLTIATGCTGGKHRSVALTQALFTRFKERFSHEPESLGRAAVVRHRDITRG